MFFKFLKKSLALLNSIEGFAHIIVAIIGFWGLIVGDIGDWKLWVAPVEK